MEAFQLQERVNQRGELTLCQNKPTVWGAFTSVVQRELVWVILLMQRLKPVLKAGPLKDLSRCWGTLFSKLVRTLADGSKV